MMAGYLVLAAPKPRPLKELRILYLSKLDDEDKENMILGDTNSKMFTPTKLDSNAKCLKFVSQIYQYIIMVFTLRHSRHVGGRKNKNTH